MGHISKKQEAMFDYYAAIPLMEAQSRPEIAVEMNELAIGCRVQDELQKAEILLRKGLDIEKSAYPTDHPKLPHRMNNLTVLFMLQGRLPEALRMNYEAWELKIGRHDLTSERILMVRMMLCQLTGISYEKPLGQLKTLLTGPEMVMSGDINRIWKFEKTMQFIQARVSEEQHRLLAALLEAHNHRPTVSALEAFPLWVDQPLLSVEEPWRDVG